MSVTPPAPRRGVSGQLVVGVLGALVGLVFALLLFRAAGPDTAVSGQLRTYVVQSDSAVLVELDVARPPGTAVVCLVRASAASGAEVGRLEADIPPADERSTLERVTVPTTGRAVNGELVGCREGRAGEPPAP